METTSFTKMDSRTNPNFGIISFILIIMLVMLFYLTWVENEVFYQFDKPLISHSELVEAHGLQVESVRLSPDGEFINFHLAVVDPVKANRLLADPDITIGIWVVDTGTHLMVGENIAEEDLINREGFVLSLSNMDGIVHSGMDVYAVFGNLFVEPVSYTHLTLPTKRIV